MTKEITMTKTLTNRDYIVGLAKKQNIKGTGKKNMVKLMKEITTSIKQKPKPKTKPKQKPKPKTKPKAKKK